MSRRSFGQRPLVEDPDKMQGFPDPVGPRPDSNLAQRRESPIEAQEKLPMSRVALSAAVWKKIRLILY